LSSYAINLDVVSLFADSPVTILTMFVFDVLYQFERMNIVLFLSKKIDGYQWQINKGLT